MIRLIHFHKSQDAHCLGESRHFAATDAYLTFQQKYFGDEILLATDETTKLGLALRVYRVRMFRIGQILAPPRIEGERASATTEETFLTELLQALRHERMCHLMIQPPPHCLFQAIPRKARGCAFGTYCLDLQGRNEEEILSAMHPDHRRKIKVSQRQGAETFFGENHLPAFYELHSQTMRRARLHCPKFDFFQSLYESLTSNQALCAVTYFEGKPQAGAFVPFSVADGGYLYGGSTTEVQPSGAVKQMHWDIIRALKKLGVRRYDLVGTRLRDVSGTPLEYIQRFKARFGGTLERGFLWKADILPTTAGWYRLLTRIRRSCAGYWRVTPDIIEQEIRLGVSRNP